MAWSQFYETGIFGTFGETPYGFQVLTSPATILSVRSPHPPSSALDFVDYEQLLADLEFVGPISRREVALRVAQLALPFQEALEPEMHADLVAGFAAWLPTEELIPGEASPFGLRTLAELSAAAGATYFVVHGEVPMVFLVGGSVGLVVFRGARAISGALWEGIRPEIASFGADAAAHVLNILRNRLGISERVGSRSTWDDR
jgi:hypothetical protein